MFYFKGYDLYLVIEGVKGEGGDLYYIVVEIKIMFFYSDLFCL